MQFQSLIKPNFKHKPIFSSYGLIILPLIAASAFVILNFKLMNKNQAVLFLCPMTVMCILGALDDVYGSRETGGFKGHFKKLFVEHKLTTGALKAFGGGAAALIIAWLLSGGDIVRWIIGSMVIALTTNTINILDLRPGRASAAFFFILLLAYSVCGWHLHPQKFVNALEIIVFIFYLFDRQAKIMMGDSGSNMLGIALGILIALNCGLIFQTIMVIMQLLMQLYSEKKSITKLIQKNRFLNLVDSKLGVR
jgi:UDP-GlcNAc:undecaprenyl-phosphate/decaprenyl-phosphate GlcNAc-1-phosphate transferase